MRFQQVNLVVSPENFLCDFGHESLSKIENRKSKIENATRRSAQLAGQNPPSSITHFKRVVILNVVKDLSAYAEQGFSIAVPCRNLIVFSAQLAGQNPPSSITHFKRVVILNVVKDLSAYAKQ
ncbi:MAG: hypothetical protein KDB65_06625 [Calditrichaeota bacterium]|nr:hypothetical protein [Calditrichota bacterium]